MTAVALIGFLLLAGGPPVVVWCTFIASKSFLVLLGLASSFYWLLVLLLTASVFRAFVPLPENVAIYVLALFIAVTFQECARYGAYLINQQMVKALQSFSREADAPTITETDKLSLALTHGMGHAIAQTAFMYFSWIGLAAGEGTFYVDACPQMSYWLAAGWLTVAFFMLHCFSMVVAFYGMDKKLWKLPIAVAVLHFIASMTTALNLISGACVTVAVLALLEGLVAVAAAILVCIHQASNTHHVLASSDPEDQ